MKNLIYVSILVVLISCGNEKSDFSQKKDTIFITDTVLVFPTPNGINYPVEELPMFQTDKKRLYDLIKNTNIDSSYRSKFARHYVPSSAVKLLLYDDKMVNDAVILFFLKLYYTNLINDSYGYNVSVSSDYDPYLLLFSYQFFKLSKTAGPLYTSDVYFWVLNQPTYLSNKDIKAEVDKIELCRKKKK